MTIDLIAVVWLVMFSSVTDEPRFLPFHNWEACEAARTILIGKYGRSAEERTVCIAGHLNEQV